MPPTGAVLGSNAIAFVDGPLAESFGRDPRDLRYAVSFVDDVYGRSVASGALQAAAELDLDVVGRFGYDFRDRRLRRPRAAYRPVRGRRAVRLGLPRRRDRAAPGARATTTSTCSPASARRRRTACRSSARPSARMPSGCSPPTSRAATRSTPRRFAPRAPSCSPGRAPPTTTAGASEMSPAALAGFSAAWALFAEVMPAAAEHGSLSPDAIAAAALEAELPMGSLPNGSGLRFGAAGHRDRRRQRGRGRRHLGVDGARRAHGRLAAASSPPTRCARWTSPREHGVGRSNRALAASAGARAARGRRPTRRSPPGRARSHRSPAGPLLDGLGPVNYRWVDAAARARDHEPGAERRAGSSCRSRHRAWARRSCSRRTARSRS